MLREDYDLMWRNFKVGTIQAVPIIIDKSSKPLLYILDFKYVPNPEDFSSDKKHLCYPLGMYPVKDYSTLSPDTTFKPRDKNVRFWLGSRIVPSDREDINKILRKLKISHYNMWWINKYTHSMNLSDYYWIKSPKEDLNFEDFHPKHLLETKQVDKLHKLYKTGFLPY